MSRLHRCFSLLLLVICLGHCSKKEKEAGDEPEPTPEATAGSAKASTKDVERCVAGIGQLDEAPTSWLMIASFCAVCPDFEEGTMAGAKELAACGYDGKGLSPKSSAGWFVLERARGWLGSAGKKMPALRVALTAPAETQKAWEVPAAQGISYPASAQQIYVRVEAGNLRAGHVPFARVADDGTVSVVGDYSLGMSSVGEAVSDYQPKIVGRASGTVPSGEPQLARAQAIEAARQAGVLGALIGEGGADSPDETERVRFIAEKGFVIKRGGYTNPILVARGSESVAEIAGALAGSSSQVRLGVVDERTGELTEHACVIDFTGAPAWHAIRVHETSIDFASVEKDKKTIEYTPGSPPSSSLKEYFYSYDCESIALVWREGMTVAELVAILDSLYDAEHMPPIIVLAPPTTDTSWIDQPVAKRVL